ncbi:hypothetical protein HID58_086229, partial [Brassica napus]
MNSTASTRSRRIVVQLTEYCDGKFLHPPCQFESWALLQHCRISFAEVLRSEECEERRVETLSLAPAYRRSGERSHRITPAKSLSLLASR